MFPRGFRLFELAEVLAVAALVAGLAMYLAHRRASGAVPLSWPGRLILAGSAIGLGGLLLKGLFLLLGVGAGHHDMATHVTTPGNPYYSKETIAGLTTPGAYPGLYTGAGGP